MPIDKTIKIDVEATQGIKEIDKLKKGVQDTSKGAKDSKGSFNVMEAGIRGVGLAFKAMGIGLIVAGFVALKDALQKNQVFMDKVNIANAVFGDVMNKIGKVVMSVVKGLGLLGKAVGKVLKGEFKEAGDLAKQSFDGVKEAVVGNNESFSDFIKNAKESAKESVAFAKAMVNMRNEVKLADAQQRQLQLTYQKEAEIQRQIRDDISLTFEERIAANEKLGQVLDQQFAEEQALAQKKVELAELELSRNKNNIDLQVALINAKTELADLDERITGQRSEQLTNLKALEKEQADAIQVSIDLKKKEVEQKLALERKKAKEEEKIVKDRIGRVKSMEIQAAQSILGSLGQLAGEGTKLAKATALANILINSAQGVSAAIKAGAGLPFPANLGAIATGVAAVLSGIVSAKAIFKKVKTPGGGGGGGDIDVSATSAPATPTGIGGEGLIPNLEGIEATGLGEPQPVQAYVVENDISNAQALQQELDVQATL
jgi:hypothetical protein